MSKGSKTITEKLAELGELTAWFESDEFTLEAALDKFAEAEKLAKEIDDNLAELKNKITVLKTDFSK